MGNGEKRELVQVNVRLAAHVVALLEQRAREAGMNVSEYVRTLVTVNLGLTTPPPRDGLTALQMFRQAAPSTVR